MKNLLNEPPVYGRDKLLIADLILERAQITGVTRISREGKVVLVHFDASVPGNSLEHLMFYDEKSAVAFEKIISQYCNN